MKTNRFFYKKAEKGWAIMKRRVDGYIVSSSGWHHGRKHGSKFISSTDGVEIIPCNSIQKTLI